MKTSPTPRWIEVQKGDFSGENLQNCYEGNNWTETNCPKFVWIWHYLIIAAGGTYRVFFLTDPPIKKLKYVKTGLGVSTLT